jgi:hypothetical protein
LANHSSLFIADVLFDVFSVKFLGLLKLRAAFFHAALDRSELFAVWAGCTSIGILVNVVAMDPKNGRRNPEEFELFSAWSEG